MSCVNSLDESPYISLFNRMGLPILDGIADMEGGHGAEVQSAGGEEDH